VSCLASPIHPKNSCTKIRVKSVDKPLQNPYFFHQLVSKKGVDNAFIQYFFGFSIQQSLIFDSPPSLQEIQEIYNRAMTDFPV